MDKVLYFTLLYLSLLDLTLPSITFHYLPLPYGFSENEVAGKALAQNTRTRQNQSLGKLKPGAAVLR